MAVSPSSRVAPENRPRRLKTSGDVVAVQCQVALHRGVCEGLRDMLRQVACRTSRLRQLPRAYRKVAEQLDLNEAMRPGLHERRSLDKPSHREVGMQTVARLVPLGNPRMRERLPTQPRSKVTEDDPR